MTRRGASPAAHRRSASTRSSAHEYDPGLPRGEGGSTPARSSDNARERWAV
jgi:hypothetical protein